ncbi:MAG: CGNR zinc finger domain-containing protein [Aldersonia sp.]|nr:CGNR zinc finger domain-containing protein [Aldersonia sp.]
MGERDAVRLVLDFVNSLDVEDGTDAFAEQADFREWTQEHLGMSGEGVTRRDWVAARRLRDTLRAAIGGQSAAEPPAVVVPLQLALTPDGTVSLSGRKPAEIVAAAVAELALAGDWARLKICPADDCQVGFYDRSRNQSRQWCSMAVCGNRAKARAHRDRVT